MKRLFALIIALPAFALGVHGMPPSQGAEPYRGDIRPYSSESEAFARAGGASRYISPMGDWTRGERDGKTLFTTEFVYPAAWLNRQILVRVGSASAGYSVEVGGERVGYTRNGADPTEFNVTKYAVQGLNTLTIAVDGDGEGLPLAKAGVAWVGRVEVVSQPTIRVRDIDCRTKLDESGDGILEVAIAVKTDALNPKKSRISYELTSPDTVQLAFGYRDVSIDMRGEDTVRFMAKVPRKWLWSSESPSLLTLSVRNRIDGRYAENIALPIGAREIEYSSGKLKVNGEAVALKTRVVAANTPAAELERLKADGYNAVTLRAGDAALDLYAACDSAGVYVIPQMAVDTSDGGRSIRRGGNPSNDPDLTDDYLERALAMYHAAKVHPSVAAFSLGHGVTNGINPYESYLLLKRLDGVRPVIYDGAGKEWNNDHLEMQITAPLQ